MNYTPKLSTLLLLMGIVFISCSKKNNTNPATGATLAGRWYLTADTVNEYSYPGNIFIEKLQTGITLNSYAEYRSDGTGTNYLPDETVIFTYKIAANSLIFNVPEQMINGTLSRATTDTVAIKTFTNNSLVTYQEFIDPANGGLRYKTTVTEYFVKK